MAQIREGLAAWHAMGSEVFQPYGLALLAEALALINEKGERRWEAELHRLQGEVLLAHSAGRS